MISSISAVLLVGNSQFVSLFCVSLRIFFTVNNWFTAHVTQLYGSIHVLQDGEWVYRDMARDCFSQTVSSLFHAANKHIRNLLSNSAT